MRKVTKQANTDLLKAMYTILLHMNNEDAYYNSLHSFVDGAGIEDIEEMAED